MEKTFGIGLIGNLYIPLPTSNKSKYVASKVAKNTAEIDGLVQNR